MGTKTYNNYEDLLTFTRASKGHALRPVSYGTELVENGGFATDSDWTKVGDATISGDEGHIVSTGSYVSLNQNIGAEAGKIYFVTVDVTVNSGAGVYIGIGGGAVGSQRYDATYTGTHSFALLAGTNDSNVQITRANATDTDLDNISVKEVTFDESDGTLTLFEHPDNIPRVEYDAAGNRLGLLVEEQRVNKFTYSEAFNESNWQRPGSSYAASTLAFTEQSPTKIANSAATLIDDNSGGTGQAYIRSLVSGLALSTPHTFSVFAKKDQLSYLALETKFFTVPTAIVYFDLDAGTVGTATNCTGAIQAYPDGWYRCSLTFTTDASDTSGYRYIYLADGDGDATVNRDGTSSVFIFGAQFEEGSFPTSYIKTTGVTATRSADVASIPVADFGYNHNKGTVLVEFQQDFEYGGTGFPRVFEIGDPSTERINVFINESSGVLVAGANFNNANQAGLVLKTETDGTVEATKVAYAFADDDFAASDDGDTVAIDTSGSFSGGTPRTKLLLGPSNFCGHIKSIKYYPRRLTNAQLQDLTS